ncbi:uncharacterized protein LOC141612796 [Silene latifolia]|uniref:uncharacterized protein LOC141612796 n=1 Tax=Silene latifolia TaxID=37657 RepID=UPI003D788B25
MVNKFDFNSVEQSCVPLCLSASQLVSEAHKEAVNSLSGSGSAQLGIVAADNSALRATTNASQLVSKADKEAENSISESDSAQLGTVAVANSAALEVTPGIDAAMPISLRNTWESMFNVPLDDLANDTAIIKLRVCEEKVRELRKETDQLVKQKDLAIKETHLRRAELGKVRGQVAFLEAAVVRAEEKQRNVEIEVEAKVKEQREAESLLEKQFLLAYIYALEAEFQR